MDVKKVTQKKLIMVAAPSGAGKTTIVRHLLKTLPEQLAFSISATNRKPRPAETDGRDYYFLSTEAFKEKIKNKAFVEWEEVYENAFYGTLISEVERIWALGKHVIFDVDVKGALNIKLQYPEISLSLFIDPPDIETLENRLKKRKTETEHSIARRLRKAAHELQFKSRFDAVVLNDDLDLAKAQAIEIVQAFLKTELVVKVKE